MWFVSRCYWLRLHEDMDEALDELQDTRKRLWEAEALIRELQKSINAMSSSSDSGQDAKREAAQGRMMEMLEQVLQHEWEHKDENSTSNTASPHA